VCQTLQLVEALGDVRQKADVLPASEHIYRPASNISNSNVVRGGCWLCRRRRPPQCELADPRQKTSAASGAAVTTGWQLREEARAELLAQTRAEAALHARLRADYEALFLARLPAPLRALVLAELTGDYEAPTSAPYSAPPSAYPSASSSAPPSAPPSVPQPYAGSSGVGTQPVLAELTGDYEAPTSAPYSAPPSAYPSASSSTPPSAPPSVPQPSAGSSGVGAQLVTSPPVCNCGQPAGRHITVKHNDNKGRHFYKCRSGACGNSYFAWDDEERRDAEDNWYTPSGPKSPHALPGTTQVNSRVHVCVAVNVEVMHKGSGRCRRSPESTRWRRRLPPVS